MLPRLSGEVSMGETVTIARMPADQRESRGLFDQARQDRSQGARLRQDRSRARQGAGLLQRRHPRHQRRVRRRNPRRLGVSGVARNTAPVHRGLLGLGRRLAAGLRVGPVPWVVDNKPFGQVEGGFVTAMLALWPLARQALAPIDLKSKKGIIVSGHSKGAAMSFLAASLLKSAHPTILVQDLLLRAAADLRPHVPRQVQCPGLAAVHGAAPE
jgi:Lipase (class 3)